MSWWGQFAIIAELGLILIVLGALYYRAARSEAARAASPGRRAMTSRTDRLLGIALALLLAWGWLGVFAHMLGIWD